MQFEEIFFERADLLKFQLFQVLSTFDADSLTITDLSAKMTLSYQQTYNIFQELVEDISQLTTMTRADTKKALTMPKHLPVTIDDYRVALLKNAVSFQFLDYLIQGNSPSVDRFCSDRFISRSTLLRKTAALRKFLERYQMKLSLSQPGMIGSEQQIRFFLHAVYWLGFHSADWPFKSIDRHLLMEQYQTLETASHNPLVAAQERTFWALSRIRIGRGHYLTEMEAFETVLGPLLENHPAVYKLAYFPSVAPKVLREETIFFYFFQKKRVNFDPLGEPEFALLNYFKEAPAPCWSFVRRLLHFLQRHSSRPEAPILHQHAPLVLNLLRVSLSYYLMPCNYVRQNAFFAADRKTPRQQWLHHLLQEYIQTLPEDGAYASFQTHCASLSDALFFLLVPHLDEFDHDDKVRVYLLLETHDILNRELTDFLDNTLYVERLSKTAPISSADLVITEFDHSHRVLAAEGSDQPEQIFMNWYLDVTSADYDQLSRCLAALYHKKLLA